MVEKMREKKVAVQAKSDQHLVKNFTRLVSFAVYVEKVCETE